MKRIDIVGSSEVKVHPFILDDFIEKNIVHRMNKKVAKRELKHLADRVGLAYDEAGLVFAKKLLNAYLAGK